MSKSNAIKTFRDLLAFLTIIPMGSGEDFVTTSAEFMFLFPLIGGLIGLFAAGYFQGSFFIVSNVLMFANSHLQVLPVDLLLKLALAIMALAFLLVLTGLQHFDGLVDLGNAIGLNKLEERREAAHAWFVSYKGAALALSVEFVAFLGLFFLNWQTAFIAILAAEVAAKLAMVTIVAVGQPAHKGLGARFMEKAKQKRNILAYVISSLIILPLLGWIGLLVIAASVLVGVLMERVGKSVFGGVSGDMIGATNETARAVTLILLAGALAL
jgi:adenosylcobinamide-GDP ribazoletransferase